MSLFIQKVPTIVSLSQMLEDEETPGQFCSPEEPIGDCKGRLLPTIVYPFTEASHPRRARSFGQINLSTIEKTFSNMGAGSPGGGAAGSDDTCSEESECSGGSVVGAGSDSASTKDMTTEGSTGSSDGADGTAASLAEKVLVKEWDRRAEQGLFRYDVRSCPSKVTDGVYGFIVQLNEGRATKKRATEFRVDKVCQPFDGRKFNFQKAAMKEVLFQFQAGGVPATRYHSTRPCAPSPNVVLINVSPIEYGHVLLVPRVNDGIPQVVDQTSMLFALQCAHSVGSPFFRLGYNSLGAFGTINHLHFQGYFLEQPYPVERAPTAPLAGVPQQVRGVRIERLQGYPVAGWVLTCADNVDPLAAAVGAACMRLQALDVPHNLLICDSGSRVMLWPQCFAAKQARGEVPEAVLETGVNPAAFEIAGHMVLKRAEDYDGMTEERAWQVLQEVSVGEARLAELEADLFAAYMS